VGGLCDRLLEANNQIGRLEQENILLRFEIEQEEAQVQALRRLNPAPPNEPEGPDPQNEPAPLSSTGPPLWVSPAGSKGARTDRPGEYPLFDRRSGCSSGSSAFLGPALFGRARFAVEYSGLNRLPEPELGQGQRKK